MSRVGTDMKTARSIRVNLRFGPRTDPELMREIGALPAYKRARFLRKLLEQAWRSRHEPQPRITEARVSEPQIVSSGGGEETGFSAEVLALFGKSVRL